LFWAVGPASAIVAYSITDLGTLGGQQSYTYGVNILGQVVGWANYSPTVGNEDAFLYSHGTMTNLGTLGGTYSDAYGINASGQIVGTAGLATGSGHAFLCSGSGPLYDLTPSISGGTVAVSVNGGGQAVGYIASSGLQYSALFSGGSVTYISAALPPSTNGANDINDKGQIVGWRSGYDYTGSYGYLYSGGTATTLSGVWNCEAINNSGQVVGASNPNGDIPYQPILYQNGILQNLPVPVGYAGGWAYDINNNGQIVGALLNNAWQYSGGFLYSGGTTQDLQSLIPPSSGWTSLTPRSISDNGFVVGQGTHNGVSHAFLLTPIPEPSTFALLGIGALGLLAFAWQWRRT
jgi:probable HAF family extracellular repeat protein